jgi:drug/metabolite transporter superfamily protein YnfA
VTTLAMLVLAALLEMGGDAAIRHGLLRPAWRWLVVGPLMLVAYGFVVNANRAIDFGRLMGLYVALLFVVSQAFSIVVFSERPSASLVLGGALIVAGGAVIQLGAK